jgi:hypothetical protein
MTQVWVPRSYATAPSPQIRQMFARTAAQTYDECDNCGTLLHWRLEADEDAHWQQAGCVCGHTYTRDLEGTITGSWNSDGFPVGA